jgi:hypothetical protein
MAIVLVFQSIKDIFLLFIFQIKFSYSCLPGVGVCLSISQCLGLGLGLCSLWPPLYAVLIVGLQV